MMNGDGQLFDTESLSFDSTLESLLEADYLMDDKDTYIPPTGAEMSTQENNGVDFRPSECGTNGETSVPDSKDKSADSIGGHTETNSHDEPETIVEETNGLHNTKTSPESPNIQNTSSNETKKSQLGIIENLNFEELKAKRKRKIAEIELSKAPESNANRKHKTKEKHVFEKDSVVEIKDNAIASTGTLFVNGKGKRKLDNSNESLSNKMHKPDNDSFKNTAIDTHSSPIDSEPLINQDKNLDTNKLDEQNKLCNTSSENSSSNVTIECPNAMEDDHINMEQSSGDTANNSVDDTLTEDITLVPDTDDTEEVASLQEEDIVEIDTDHMDGTGPAGDNTEELDSEDDDSDLDDNEIDAWLDEGLVKKENPETEQKDGEKEEIRPEFTSREKRMLEEKGVSPFDVLPSGWVQVHHVSGMMVYLHKETRVCSMARPYALGPLSARRHEVPVSAIPCLQYQRALKKEQEEKEEKINGEREQQNGEPTDNQKEADKIKEHGMNMPQAVLQEMENAQLLQGEELFEYCSRLFKFQTVMVKKFRTWKEKRVHMVKQKKKLPGLHNTKLITCALPSDPDNKLNKRKKEFILNPAGKTAVCILHEYTQHMMRIQPSYVFKEIENSETPFKATIVINGIQYGSGVASGKRQAKAEAAKKTLEIFMPNIAEQLMDMGPGGSKPEPASDLNFFEDVDIEDPRVTDLCEKAALPKPFQLLIECLRRNFGLGDTNLIVNKKLISNQRTEFSLNVGKHTAKIICKNKREGKQRAAQVMLKKLHPHLTSWAALLRLYSKDTELGFKEREDESNAEKNKYNKEKNFEILDKLKEAMLKVRAQRAEQVKPSSSADPQTVTKTVDL